jgi:hypothetical protein
MVLYARQHVASLGPTYGPYARQHVASLVPTYGPLC